MCQTIRRRIECISCALEWVRSHRPLGRLGASEIDASSPPNPRPPPLGPRRVCGAGVRSGAASGEGPSVSVPTSATVALLYQICSHHPPRAASPADTPPSPSPRGRPQCAQLPPRLPRSPPFCPSPPRFPPPRLTCACHAHPPRGAPTPPHHGGLCRGCRVCAGGGFPADWRSQRPPADRFDGHPASGGAPGRVGHLDEGTE